MKPNSQTRAVISIDNPEQLREARRILRQEAESLSRLADNLDASFCDAVQLIRNTAGCVIVTGVGKAGLIGQKLVATFASTGTRSHFMHPTEARHGDLGCVSPDDVVLAISNSGESEELVSLIPVLRQMAIPLIALTRDTTNTLARFADVVVPIGKHAEAGELGLAPSCSTTAMLALGDALALRASALCSLSDDELSPAALAARVVLADCTRDAVRSGRWVGARLTCETPA